jgi:hypothetical protein
MLGVQLPQSGAHTRQITTCRGTASSAWSSYLADNYMLGHSFLSKELIPYR